MMKKMNFNTIVKYSLTLSRVGGCIIQRVVYCFEKRCVGGES